MNKIKSNYNIGFGYKFGVYTPSESTPNPLGYTTLEGAERLRDRLNKSLENFDDVDSPWNKTHWKTKPEPYVVCELIY